MRLLNTSDLRLEEFNERDRPPYAILSHRWTDHEKSFCHVQTGNLRGKLGYVKIQKFCDLARKEGLSHAWVDTCCIDRSNSVELSEAINSMFRWYQEAKVCFVYLHDAYAAEDFTDSDWFNRGWTLQELLAPISVRFYAHGWLAIGDRGSLAEPLSERTGINPYCLAPGRRQPLDEVPIVERMSWAAKRQTTKPEDMAYCLLGIFGINMAPLYGEGAVAAFRRLQHKILKRSTEIWWLFWEDSIPHSDSSSPTWRPSYSLAGVLAREPRCFESYSWASLSRMPAGPVIITNLGIHVELPLQTEFSQHYLWLPVFDDLKTTHSFVRIPVLEQDGVFFRQQDKTPGLCIISNRRAVPKSTRMILGKEEPHDIPEVALSVLFLGENARGLGNTMGKDDRALELPLQWILGGYNSKGCHVSRMIRFTKPTNESGVQLPYDILLLVSTEHSILSFVLQFRHQVPLVQKLLDYLGIVVPMMGRKLPSRLAWLQFWRIVPGAEDLCPDYRRLVCRLAISGPESHTGTEHPMSDRWASTLHIPEWQCDLYVLPSRNEPRTTKSLFAVLISDVKLDHENRHRRPGFISRWENVQVTLPFGDVQC